MTLKAINYEILRNVKVSGLQNIPMARKPVKVATMMDEASFNEDQLLIHLKTVFLEDYIHDWNWSDGQFRFYTRVAEVADVLVVYEIADVQPVGKFDPMTGKRL